MLQRKVYLDGFKAQPNDIFDFDIPKHLKDCVPEPLPELGCPLKRAARRDYADGAEFGGVADADIPLSAVHIHRKPVRS